MLRSKEVPCEPTEVITTVINGRTGEVTRYTHVRTTAIVYWEDGEPCEHGSTGKETCTAGRDERSSCCDWPVTYSGDGDLYCKCCGAPADWASDLANEGMVHIINIKGEPR